MSNVYLISIPSASALANCPPQEDDLSRFKDDATALDQLLQKLDKIKGFQSEESLKSQYAELLSAIQAAGAKVADDIAELPYSSDPAARAFARDPDSGFGALKFLFTTDAEGGKLPSMQSASQGSVDDMAKLCAYYLDTDNREELASLMNSIEKITQ